MGLLKAATTRSPSMSAGDSHNFVGAESFRTRNPGYGFLNCYTSDSYASIYPSVKAITNEFMTIRPFAIDAKGKVQERTSVVNALYHPNQQDSSVAFFEKLAVMNLTHRKTYVLVWRREGREAKPGGEITPDNIAGFTFLERPAITRRDKKSYYSIGSQEFTEDEVMVIPGGVDPDNLDAGYAPGEASRRWATLDGYIADYQKGFFENGAVPAGQFIITASSQKDYEETVEAMQSKHRGAGRNNNVTYTPRPVDPNTGKPGDSKIEWIPFASSNKEIDFKNLFEQANNRIDSTYGVPASIRGVGENNNYATAQTDRQNFIRFAVSPLALRIYTQITHELNRITNGLGVAVTYELELPPIADDEKVKAETKKIEVDTIKTLIDMNFSIDSIVDALKLSTDYKKLTASSTNPDEDKPEVDEGGEVEKSPDPEKIDGVTPLGKKKGAAKRKNPKAEVDHEEKMRVAARKLLKAQIDDAIAELDEQAQGVIGDAGADDLAEFSDEMLRIVTELVIAAGTLQHEDGLALLVSAGIDTQSVTDFAFTDDLSTSYRVYLNNVGNSYSEDTAQVIRSVLDNAQTEGLPAQEIKKQLRDLTSLEEYRVERIARTETVRAGGNGSLYSMQQIENESTATINKIWNTSRADACPTCKALDGKTVGLSTPFVALGESVTGTDGGTYVNDFVDADITAIHPNDSCYITYEVTR